MSAPPPIVVVLWNDGGEALAAAVEAEEQQDVLRSFAGLVSDVIDAVLELPQFRHVQAVEVDDGGDIPTPSPLSIAFAAGSASGEIDMEKLKAKLDVGGLLVGSAALPAELDGVASVAVPEDEEDESPPELQVSDEGVAKQLTAIIKRARLERRYTDWYGGVEEALGPALDAAAAGVEVTAVPLDPFDVIQALLLQLISVAGVSPPQPSLLSRGRALVGRVLRAPQAVLRAAGARVRRVQRLWWRLEDVLVDGSRVAAKLALKAARPVLVGFVVHRALKTLTYSRSLEVRLSKMNTDEGVEYYYRHLLGDDWRAQIQEDVNKAVADVNEGLVTDEINQEKRLLTAAAIRRLELEDWDKQRMKNFYLASYGGLRWFDQMEQALHNPMFIESRGWTDPVQNWVGTNRTYMADLPAGAYMSDVGGVAVRLKEAELRRKLNDEERARVLARGAAAAGGLLPTSNKELAAAALAAGGAIVSRPAKK